MILDAHTHLLPDRLAAKIRQFFNAHIGEMTLYPPDVAGAKAALQRAGVDRCLSLPYAHKGGMAGELNRWMAATFAGDPLVIPGGTLHPEDDVAAVVDEAVGPLGLRAIKLHCSVGRFAVDDDRLTPLWERVSHSGHPVVVHGGHAIDGTTASADLAAVGDVARRWPKARVIIAHCGAPAVAQALDLLRAHPSLYADLTPVVFDPVPVSRTLIAGLEDRLLFGSDAPNVAVPIEAVIAAIRAWRLPAAQEARILGGTAASLLGV